MLYNEKGLSLVELLAGIVLLGIITTLTTIILTNSFDSKDTADKQISLKQETNAMISSLRNEYFKEENLNNYEEGRKVCFNKGSVEINLDDTNTSILESSYKNGLFVLEGNNLCLTNFDYSKPVEFTLYVFNSKQDLHVSTLLPQRIDDKGSDYNLVTGCAIKLNKPTEYKTLPCTAKGDIIWTGNSTSCQKTVIEGNLLSKGKLDNNSLENKTLTVNKNACFANEIHPRQATIVVKKNAEFTNQVEFVDGSTLTVIHNAKFNNQQTQFYSSSTFSIDGDVIFEKGLQTQASNLKELYVKGNVKSKGPFQLENFTKLKIDGFATFEGTVDLQNQSSLIVIKDLNSLSGEFQLNKSTLKVSGKAAFKNNSLQISDDSVLCAKFFEAGNYQGKANIEKKCN